MLANLNYYDDNTVMVARTIVGVLSLQPLQSSFKCMKRKKLMNNGISYENSYLIRMSANLPKPIDAVVFAHMPNVFAVLPVPVCVIKLLKCLG